MRPRLLDLAVHVARLVVAVLVMAAASSVSSRCGMVAGAGLFFLEAFALMHDVSHGALLLPRRANEVALALSGALLLMSGHALRALHLVHHARALADDDLEGRPARGTLWRALAGGLRAAVELRLHAFAGAGRRGRAWQAIETVAGVIVGCALLASGRAPLVTYALVAILAQATMAVWAAYIPHNAPAWLTRLAARFAWTGSPTMLSLAYHELHHARPEVPCRRLPALAGFSPSAG
jgi:fatty acid desaturase